MHKNYPTLLLLSLLWTPLIQAQQILSVTPSGQPPYDNMTNLIRDHFTGSGIEILNVESANDSTAIGYFTDGESSIGIKRGLIMTTGAAFNADLQGMDFASNGNNGGSVQDELAVIAQWPTFNDVAYFRVTFRPFSDSIRFRYLFASEEYPEYACTSFNDIFGFFLSGPNPLGGNYDDLNIALIPGTSLPVSVNTLHIQNPNDPSCTPINEQFYHDNLNSSLQPVYDGFTDVFSAEASVIPCATYQMVLAIADVGDSAFDSAVFLEAKSWESELDITSNIVVGNDVIPENAVADTILLSFSQVPASILPLEVRVEGTASNGLDYQAVSPSIQVNTSGEIIQVIVQPNPDMLQEPVETVVLNVYGAGNSDCLLRSFTLYIADTDSLYDPVDSLIIAPGENLTLVATPTSLSNQEWAFSNTSSKSIFPEGNLVKSGVNVVMPFDVLNDPALIQSVCVNVNHPWNDDLDLYLIAPNGTFVELSTDNGGNGDNYTNTCFSPGATEEIRGGFPFAPASASPFTGSFQPEGAWSDIVGTPINGIWSLGAVDDNNGLTGEIMDWTLRFSTNAFGQFSYLWNTGATTHTLEVNQPGTYTVVMSNSISTLVKTFVVTDNSVGTSSLANETSRFKIFPNPTSGETQLMAIGQTKVKYVKVFDLQGTLLLEQNSAGPIQGTSNLQRGIYLIEIATEQGVWVDKLIRR